MLEDAIDAACNTVKGSTFLIRSAIGSTSSFDVPTMAVAIHEKSICIDAMKSGNLNPERSYKHFTEFTNIMLVVKLKRTITKIRKSGGIFGGISFSASSTSIRVPMDSWQLPDSYGWLHWDFPFCLNFETSFPSLSFGNCMSITLSKKCLFEICSWR